MGKSSIHDAGPKSYMLVLDAEPISPKSSSSTVTAPSNDESHPLQLSVAEPVPVDPVHHTNTPSGNTPTSFNEYSDVASPAQEVARVVPVLFWTGNALENPYVVGKS